MYKWTQASRTKCRVDLFDAALPVVADHTTHGDAAAGLDVLPDPSRDGILALAAVVKAVHLGKLSATFSHWVL